MSMFEVNLVPDIKRQLLRARSLKRLITSICTLVVLVGIGVLAILGAVVTTQAVTSAQRDKDMDQEWAKFMANDNINASLTIQNQLTRLQQVFDGRKELSRIFPVMATILPDGGEYKVSLASMNINFTNNVIYIEGQAQSTTLNDYEALVAFEDTIVRTTYDYGRYYNKDGEVIPTIDITEVTENGSIYGIYQPRTCTPVAIPDAEEDTNAEQQQECVLGDPIKIKRYGTEAGQNPNENGFYFESACQAFEVATANGGRRVQSSCKISQDGLQVAERTSGRNVTTQDVVLRFSGRLTVDENVFAFTNKHVMIIGPSRQIVTDSYDQIRDMFEEQATECDPEDRECLDNNRGGQR